MALTANATCPICIPPLIIKYNLKPWAFTPKNIHNPENLGIKWAANKKAGMITVVFEQFILYFERRTVLAQNEKVLLDNF